jgi:hypothetical protein
MSNSGEDAEGVDPVVEPPADEPLEQQELRKKVADSVHEAQAHRSGGKVAEREPEEHAEAVREWKPPEEARMTAETGRLLVRLVVFAVLVFGVYLVVQEIIGLYYAPNLRSIQAVVPSERVMPGTVTRVGLLVENRGQMEGAAFVVVAMADGEEFEGASVTVPGNDTATVWVDVPFERGDQVFSLVLFDGWRDVERLTTLPGLLVQVGEHLVALDDVDVPERVTAGDTARVTLSAENTGEYGENVRAVVILSSRSGDRPVQFQGDVTEILPGATVDLMVLVDTGSLEPGEYTADVIIATESGRKVSGVAVPIPMEVTE